MSCFELLRSSLLIMSDRTWLKFPPVLRVWVRECPPFLLLPELGTYKYYPHDDVIPHIHKTGNNIFINNPLKLVKLNIIWETRYKCILTRNWLTFPGNVMAISPPDCKEVVLWVGQSVHLALLVTIWVLYRHDSRVCTAAAGWSKGWDHSSVPTVST